MLIETKSGTGHVVVLDHDVGIPMRDGLELKANVFRPQAEGRYPVIMTLGPYGKDLHFSGHRQDSWDHLVQRYPEIFEHSTGRSMVFETPDPEVWTPHGYVVVRIDSRGCCKSPGHLDVNSPQEFVDFYDAIEWAGVQPWSNGKVGLLGVSYFACGQWMVAAKRPPHLAAISPWQGTPDFFRGRTRTGGIFCDGFVRFWWNRIVANQHGNAACELRDMVTGGRLSGTTELSTGALAANRSDYIAGILAHPLLDAYYRDRSAVLADIDLPALVVANWGGIGLHLSGTIAGYSDIASRDKWLKVQTGSYFATYYRPESVALQRLFFDRYLKGEDNGWEAEPRVEVEVKSVTDGVQRLRRSTSWPLAETRWTRLHLDASQSALNVSAGVSSASSYAAMSEGASFRSAALTDDIELAGPVKAHLHVSSSQPDMDLFLTLQAFDAQGAEITFYADNEPRQPLSQGWLRVTQRQLDHERSTPWRPVHSHAVHEPLQPGEVVEIDVEIWPASVSLPAGSSLQLCVQGKDFERAGVVGPLRGSGLFTHRDPTDRPPERFGSLHTIHTGEGRDSYIVLPVVSTSS